MLNYLVSKTNHVLHRHLVMGDDKRMYFEKMYYRAHIYNILKYSPKQTY